MNFEIRTGAVVPRSVRFASVTTFPVLVEFFPQYRDHSFFVVEDEIVIIDRSHKVVDVVPAGPRARFSRAGGARFGGGASSTTVVDLTEPEIRILQQTLIERGFLRGRVTGRFDDRTRQALIVFQRRQGFEATGRIDTRTVTSLGLSGRINAQDRSSTSQPGQSGTQTQQGQSGTQPGQSNTTGQAPSGQQSTTGQSNQPAQNQSSGQGQTGTPSAQQDKSGQAPSQGQTTGQGSPSSGGSTSSGQSDMSDQNKSSSSSTSGQGTNQQPPAQNKQPSTQDEPTAQKKQ